MIKTRTAIQFDDDKVPAWTYEGSDRSIHTFATAIALAGLEDQHIRMSAKLQTRLLGFPVFGKQKFTLRKDGTYEVTRKVCFGSDFESTCGPQGEIGLAAKLKQTIRPGWYSARTFQRN